MAPQLAQEVRVAAGALPEVERQVAVERPPRHPGQQRRRVVEAQPGENPPLADAVAPQAVEGSLDPDRRIRLVRAAGDERQQRQAGLVEHRLQQRDRRGIRPVQVIEHEQQRLLPAGMAQERGDRVEEAQAGLLRIRTDGRQRSELGEDLRQPGRLVAEQAAHLAGREAAQQHPQRLHPRPERRPALALEAAPDEDREVRGQRPLHRRRHQPRLANAGIADELDQPRAGGRHPRPRRIDRGEDVRAADERRTAGRALVHPERAPDVGEDRGVAPGCGGFRRCRSAAALHGSDEAEAAAVLDLDTRGRPARVPERLANLAHVAGDRLLVDAQSGPDGVEQFVLGHQAAGPVDEEAQHLPDLAAHMHPPAGAPELAGGEVEPVAGELQHRRRRRRCRCPAAWFAGHAALFPHRPGIVDELSISVGIRRDRSG